MGRVGRRAARQRELAQGFAANLFHFIEGAAREIADGQGGEALGQLGHGGCAVIAIGDRLRMIHDGFGVILLGDFERLRLDNGRPPRTGVIEHDSLDALRAHHRAESAARRDARGDAILVEVLDARRFQTHLAAGADERDRDLIAIALNQFCRGLVDAQTGEVVRLFPFGAVQRKMQHPPAVIFRLVLEDERVDAHGRHVETRAPARVGLLDAARQRGLAAHRNPVRGREHVADEQAGREDEFVARAERVTRRVHFIYQDARDQSAPAEALP